MDRVILVFAVIGTLMFAAYIYFIIKTSYDDEKQKKKEKAEEEAEEQAELHAGQQAKQQAEKEAEQEHKTNGTE